MDTLGGLVVLAGIISIVVWGFKYVGFKLKKRTELNQTEERLGFIGLGALLLSIFISEPTWRTLGEMLMVLGFVLLIVFAVHLIKTKFIHKTPMNKMFKGIGAGAVAVMLTGAIIDAPYAEADRLEREKTAQIEKAKAESEDKIESEKKAKAESESKQESEEKKRLEEKKKKESEAKVKLESEKKAKTESESKVRAAEESRVKAQERAVALKQEKVDAELKAQAKAAEKAAQEQQTAAPTGTTEGVSGVIIGNAKSGIYHVPGQRHYNSMTNKNKVYFNSEAEAQAAGFRRSMR